ncbi:MAG: DUF1294 domain-containing protein [Planctomycetota bacterium]
MKRRPVLFFFLVFSVLAAAAAIGLRALFSAPWWLGALVGVNLATVLLWAWDKRQSRRRGWRVPERALHLMAICGGTPGAFLAMRTLRHKTLKRHFAVLYTLVFALQIAGLWYLVPGALR